MASQKWAEADIVRAFVKGSDGLIDAVSRFPHHAIRAGDLPHRRNGKIILPDMDTFRRHTTRDLRVIVDDERNPTPPSAVMQRRGDLRDLRGRVFLRP